MCRDGRLKVGDRVLEINGADATKVPLSEAYEMLRKSDTTVTLLVEYNISVIGLLESDSFSFLSFGQNRTISHHILTASHPPLPVPPSSAVPPIPFPSLPSPSLSHSFGFC